MREMGTLERPAVKEKSVLPEQLEKRKDGIVDAVSQTTMDVVVHNLDWRKEGKDLPLSDYAGSDRFEKAANFLFDPQKKIVTVPGLAQEGVAKMRDSAASFLRKNQMIGDYSDQLIPRSIETQSRALDTTVEDMLKGNQELKTVLKSLESLTSEEANAYLVLVKTLKQAHEKLLGNNEQMKNRIAVREQSTDFQKKLSSMQAREMEADIEKRKKKLETMAETLEKVIPKFEEFEIAANVAPFAMKIQGQKRQEFISKYPDLSNETSGPKAEKAKELFLGMVLEGVSKEFPDLDQAKLKSSLDKARRWDDLYDAWAKMHRETENPMEMMSKL